MDKAAGNLFLIGFMGSGKSTVARCMARGYGMEAIEMDEMIEKQEGMRIPDIFRIHGEAYFRDLETGFLKRLRQRSGAVVSCGGGTPLRECNVAEMKKSGRVVLLFAHPETILERVKDSHDRPLLENHKDIGYISELMAQRRAKYERAADLIVCTDGKTPEEICGEIHEKLSGMSPDAVNKKEN